MQYHNDYLFVQAILEEEQADGHRGRGEATEADTASTTPEPPAAQPPQRGRGRGGRGRGRRGRGKRGRGGRATSVQITFN